MQHFLGGRGVGVLVEAEEFASSAWHFVLLPFS